jgi:hypothetical protein
VKESFPRNDRNTSISDMRLRVTLARLRQSVVRA